MTTEIIDQIQLIIDKTREDKINWQQLGPNGFRWIRTTEDGQIYNVTLQSNPIGIVPSETPPSPGAPVQMKQVFQFVLTIQLNTGALILQVQSHLQLNPTYYPLLQQLMDIVNEKARLKSLTILNKILDKL